MSLGTVFKNRITTPFRTMLTEYRNGQIKLGSARFLASVLRGSGVGNKMNSKIHNIIISQLENEFSYVLDKYKNYKYDCQYDEDAPVWVCWLQGYDDAPDIVKKCITSIQSSTNRKINFLCFDNLSDYYKLPDYIVEKHNKGYISNTEFADILRMSLLADLGGIWIDATIFIPNKLPNYIFESEFFTCKRNIDNCGYVSDYKWTTFLIGCQKGCIIQTAIKELFFEYWKNKDFLIDYLLMDYLIKIVYDNIPYAKRLIDELPFNNPQIEELQSRMSKPFDKNSYDKLINSSDTDFFKLSWRTNFKKQTKDGLYTYYYYFMKNAGEK